MKKFLIAMLSMALTFNYLTLYHDIVTNALTNEINQSSDTIVYDASTFDSFKDRTIQDVIDEYSKVSYVGESYINSDSSTYYEVAPSTKSPYNAGVLTEDTHATMTAMVNFYRWLLGEYPFKEVSKHSEDLQVGALVRCFQFAHSVDIENKPTDMDKTLWIYGANCNHNILAIGYTPQGAITGWLNEGYSTYDNSWNTIGHRNALINPEMSDVQFGYCSSVAIGDCVSSTNEYKEPFSAFPTQGYMPKNLVSCKSSAWSVYLDNDKISVEDSSNVKVTITNVDTGETFSRTLKDDTLKVSGYVLYFVQPTDVSDSDYYYDGSYSIEITGLTDVQTGKDATIEYQTDFVDISKETASYVKYAIPKFSKYIVYNTLNDTESLKKIGSTLPTEIKVIAENGKEMYLEVAQDWELDEENQCWKNHVDINNLPQNISDKLNVLDEITISYEISDDEYDYYNTLSISPSSFTFGDTVTMEIYRTMTTSDTSAIYKIITNNDNTYSAIEKYNSATSAEFDAEKSNNSSYPYHYYNVEVTDDFNGEYLSIYYLSSREYSSYNSAYVSTKIHDINVKNPTEINSVIPEISKYTIYETLNNTESLKKIGATIPKNVMITTENGNQIQLEVSGSWVLDEENQCWKNYVDTSNLSEDVAIDTQNLLDEIVVSYEVSDSIHESYNVLQISPNNCCIGDNITMAVYRNMNLTDTSIIYKIITNDDNTYSAIDKYNSTSSDEFNAEKSQESSPYHYYDINNVTLDDIGEYLSIYFDSEDRYSNNSNAYVSTSFESLQVQDLYTTTNLLILKKYLLRIAGTYDIINDLDFNHDGKINIIDIMIIKNHIIEK